MTLSQVLRRKPKRKPKSKKTNGPKGTSMNGPKMNTKGISLNENHPLKTFKTRKTNAMRKRGLNFKGNPLGTSLNFRPKLSLKNLIQQRRNQNQNSKKDSQKDSQKNSQKNTKAKGFKDRKREGLAKILENIAKSKERNIVRRIKPQEDPETILAREKKENEERIEKEYKAEANFDNLFDGVHDKQHLKMEGVNTNIARGLMMASRKAELSDYKAMKKIVDDIQRNQTEPKNNSNFPDFRGKLAKP